MVKPPNGLRSRTSPAGCGAGAGVDKDWEQKKLEATRLTAKCGEGVHALLGCIFQLTYSILNALAN